jgi:hypothetical protein
VLGFGPTRVYDLPKIRNLRISPLPVGVRGRGAAITLSGLAGGVIAFDYEAKTVRLGAWIDFAEAQIIVDRMKQRFAFPDMPTIS